MAEDGSDSRLILWAKENGIHQGTVDKLLSEGFEFQYLVDITDEDVESFKLPGPHKRRLLQTVEKLKQERKEGHYRTTVEDVSFIPERKMTTDSNSASVLDSCDNGRYRTTDEDVSFIPERKMTADSNSASVLDRCDTSGLYDHSQEVEENLRNAARETVTSLKPAEECYANDANADQVHVSSQAIHPTETGKNDFVQTSALVEESPSAVSETWKLRDDTSSGRTCTSNIELVGDMPCRSQFDALLNRLGLTEFYPQKITKHDVNVIRPNAIEAEDAESLPWKLLRGIMRLDYRVRDKTVHDFNEWLLKVKKEGQALNPQDVLNVTLQCCSLLLRQIIFEKLFSCKLAVPILMPQSTTQLEGQLWSMRTLDIEGYQNGTLMQGLATDVPSNVIVVARLGELPSSKSDFLNNFLFESKHKAFCNYNCEAGYEARLLNGQVEAVWYLPGKKTSSNVLDSITVVMNLRGDGLSFDSTLECAAALSTTCLLMADIDSLDDPQCVNMIERLTSKAKIVLLLSSSSRKLTKGQEHKKMTALDILVKSGQLKVVKAFNVNETQKNVELSRALTDVQQNGNRVILGDALFKVANERLVALDEDLGECSKGAKFAREIVAMIQGIGFESGRAAMLPLQGSHWHNFSKALKLSKRLTKSAQDQEASQSERKNEMRNERYKQFDFLQESFPPVAEKFIRVIDDNIDDGMVVDYFLKWLQLELDKCCRKTLPQLYADYRDAWQMNRDVKDKPKATQADIKRSEERIQECGKKIDYNSIGLEHIFREVGQVFEAVNTVGKKKFKKMQKGYLKHLPVLMAKLIARGHVFELMDGDASNIPTDWLQKTIDELVKLVGNKKVLLLSILGVQSSGKSTLLNTMFGMQFTVSAGRCTKGVFAQLLPVEDSAQCGYDFVLVIDTEGLRAPELGFRQHDRDNELATLSLGLGDVTIVNIKGENTEQMQDALQIAMHAFLRMRIADNKYRSKQKCIFIHNNVSSLSAQDKILQAQQSLEKTLDTMIIEAAKQESNCSIRSYREVLDLDLEKDVWYLKDLWKGSPPMAPVNPDYSESVADIRLGLLTKVFAMTDVQLRLENLHIRLTDLWDAILAEDFIFSFRNSLESKAYTSIQKQYMEIFWEAKDGALSWTDTNARSEITLCDSVPALTTCYETLKLKLREHVETLLQNSQRELDRAFDTSEFQNFVIQWKQNKKNELDLEMKEVRGKAMNILETMKENRRVELLEKSQDAKYEKDILEKAKGLARKHKGEKINPTELKREFSEMWDQWIGEISPLIPPKENLFHVFVQRILEDHFTTHSPILLEALKHNPFMCLLPYQCTKRRLSGFAKDLGDADITKRSEGLWSRMKHAVVNWSNDYRELAADDINRMLARIDAELIRISTEAQRFREEHVAKLLRMFMTDVQMYNTDESNKFTVTHQFQIKVAVMVCHMAYETLMIEHYRYEEEHGVMAKLKRFRKTCRDQFMHEVANSTAEIMASDFFSNAIKTPIQATIEREMPMMIARKLALDVGTKDHLIKVICTELADTKDFAKFVEYTTDPTAYAKNWIDLKMQNEWFSLGYDAFTMYDKKVRNQLTQKLDNVRDAIVKASENFNRERNMKGWVDDFCKAVSTHVQIPTELLRHVSETQVNDMKHYSEEILARLDADKSTLEKNLSAQNHTKWPEGSHPVNRVMEDIWGCEALCPFCREPCSNSSKTHEGMTHSCVQHRPKGSCGGWWFQTNKLVTDTCNFSIAANHRFRCSIKCHPTGESPEEWHPYPEYKKYYPDWDIRPSPCTDDYSKFWCWFMVTFEDTLPRHYRLEKAEIPDSWRSITLEEAKESLV